MGFWYEPDILIVENYELFKYEYNSNIFKNNTALRSYVYGLDKESLWLQGQDEDGNKYSRPYSRQVQTFGSNPYLGAIVLIRSTI